MMMMMMMIDDDDDDDDELPAKVKDEPESQRLVLEMSHQI